MKLDVARDSAAQVIDADWLRDVASVLSFYGTTALLVLSLVFAMFAVRRPGRDVGVLVLWTVFALCSGILIFENVLDYVASGGFEGGEVRLIPKQMFLFADSDDFYVSRSPDRESREYDDYHWIILGHHSSPLSSTLNLLLYQNIERVNIDVKTGAQGPTQLDEAPVRFSVSLSLEDLQILRNKQLTFELKTHPGSAPELIDHHKHLIAGSVISPDSDDGTEPGALPASGKLRLIRTFSISAFADVSLENPETLLNSTSATDRAAGVRMISDNWDKWKTWIVAKLVSTDTPIRERGGIIAALRHHFFNSDFVYPAPLDLSFMTPLAYERIVLDGLDLSSGLGVYSRQFLYHAGDARILAVFDTISNKILSRADDAHKSCIALFQIEVLYNWVAFMMENVQAGKNVNVQDGKEKVTSTFLQTVNTLLDNASLLRKHLVGNDSIQGARIDYLRGYIFQVSATDSSISLPAELDKRSLLMQSVNAFRDFLRKPNLADDYRYPFHIDAAREFLLSHQASTLESAQGPARPGQGCTDPSIGY